ncbi:unnamed protein product [Cercopithifilaria johnstoni]|uniref:G-protein coupled receptors family 1 profile domain-containing protein n=1 Tax=Cercopithifilaria johnstoni TaxID=2874296 RepID=A0A8J2M2D6_9BILA|nr:unnamed protein product [Cercopithifilaria johnstoni]
MKISDKEIFGNFGNGTNDMDIIQADNSIQMKCYESVNFQTFQKTVDDLLLAASVAATVFNVLVIFCAIKLLRRSGDTMHIFIISMTVGDLLLTVFCHPNEFLIRKHEFLRHALLCAITHFCNWLGLAVSGLSLTMLNLDKLIYFQWPLSYDRTIYVTWVWMFNVVYIGKNCNLQMTGDQMYFYDIFMVTYCVLPVTSSLILSGYLYQLTHEKRHNGVSMGQSQKFKSKMKSLVFIFATTLWTSFSLLPYRIFNICRMHLLEWNTLDCDTQSKMNWLAHVLLYLLFLNPIINPLITGLIYAPYRVTLKRFLFSIPNRNRSSYSYRNDQTDLSYTCACNRRSRGYRDSEITLDNEMMSLNQTMQTGMNVNTSSEGS